MKFLKTLFAVALLFAAVSGRAEQNNPWPGYDSLWPYDSVYRENTDWYSCQDSSCPTPTLSRRDIREWYKWGTVFQTVFTRYENGVQVSQSIQNNGSQYNASFGRNASAFTTILYGNGSSSVGWSTLYSSWASARSNEGGNRAFAWSYSTVAGHNAGSGSSAYPGNKMYSYGGQGAYFYVDPPVSGDYFVQSMVDSVTVYANNIAIPDKAIHPDIGSY